MAKKVTIQQIADYLGVSKYVVSRALSGKSGVKEETKEKVFQAASRLGYFLQPNRIALQGNLPLSSDNSRTRKQNVLVIMSNVRSQTKESSYWGRIIDGISSSLEALGYGMVILTDSSLEHFSSILQPEGFLGIIGVGMVSTSILLDMLRLGLPVVLIDHEDPLIPADTVFHNNFDSSCLLTRHLLGLGHRRLQFVGNIHYARSFYDRYLGFRSALELNGIREEAGSPLISLTGETQDDLYRKMEEWLQRQASGKGSMPTALCCANDSIALIVMAVLKKNNIHIPGDVSITGFDNIDESYLSSPTLTTVHVPKEELGKRAVRTLVERTQLLKQKTPFEKILISSEIMFRESTGPVRSDR